MSSPEQLVDEKHGATQAIEEALGAAGPGKEQAGDVIQETESGEQIRYGGPSTLDRAKDAVSSLAEQAGAAVASLKEKVMPTGESQVASGVHPETGRDESVAGSIAQATDSAVEDLKRGAGGES